MVVVAFLILFHTCGLAQTSNGSINARECITGDFSGEGRTDTLCVSFSSLVNGQPILTDTTLTYDSLVASTIRKKPVLQLISSKLSPLLLNKGNFYVLGLEYWKNIGNVNQVPGDEIVVIIRAADWSAINQYTVFTYAHNRWEKIRETEIREEDIPAQKAGAIKW